MLGILLIATKFPQYGRLAYNLALSIKAQENIPIAVIADEVALSHLTSIQKLVFNQIIDIKDGGMHTKLHLDQLTPFSETLYLDVDMVWLNKKPSQLFNEVKGTEFAILSEGDSEKPNSKYYFWADPKEIQDVFKVSKVHQLRSEVIYFEKTKVFKKAREVKPYKLKSIKMFGSQVPDELYFNIAVAQLGLEIKPWKPAYWLRMYNDVIPKNLNDYYLLSAGSNYASEPLKKVYDNQMRFVSHTLKTPYLFPLKSKRSWAPERLKI